MDKKNLKVKKQEVGMLQIGEMLISLDVIERKFCCDVSKCKGVCCVEGDSGAPLTVEEIDILEDELQAIKPYMRQEGIEEVEKQGAWVIDIENDKVTPLINKKECAYVVFEEGIAKCAIENAYNDGAVTFKKPLSCHLYPVRTKKYASFEAVNYDEWHICKDAIKLGKKNGLYVYQFLEAPLIRAYGADWYKELSVAADALLRSEG